MSNIESRLEALEKKLRAGDSVTLSFDDQSPITLSMSGKGNKLPAMVQGIIRGDQRWTRERDLIKRSIGSEESGGSHLIEIVKCYLDGEEQFLNPDNAHLDASE
jgi:hypothetical protein